MSDVRKGVRFGIFARTLVLTSLIVLVTIAGFAVFTIRAQRQTLERSMYEQARTLANSLDQVASHALVTNPNLPDGTESQTDQVVEHCRKVIQGSKQILYIVITRKDGFSLIHSKPGMLDAAAPKQDWDARQLSGMWTPPFADTFEASGDSERMIVDVTGQTGVVMHSDLINRSSIHYTFSFDYTGITWGWVHLGLDKKEFDNHIRGTYVMTGIVAGISLVIGMVAAFFFARRFTAPIEVLKNFARDVAVGKLDAKAAVARADELGDLAESIAKMKESLVESRAKGEAALKQEASLREKDILLREIHHRVKNNMQILSSLLRLQRRRVDHALVRGALYDSELRIRSMSLIHEKLYQSESLSSVEMGGYVSTLCRELLRMEAGGRPKDVDVQISDIRLGLDTALPCGLIINELVCNSLKYAFPDRSGTVTVKMSGPVEGSYELVVSDDGVGMKEKPDLANAKSLGLRLVGMLSEQLHGEVAFTNGVGTTVAIRFRETEYKKRV